MITLIKRDPTGAPGIRVHTLHLCLCLEATLAAPWSVWWGEQDSNLRSRKTADLQSAPVGRLGISPEPIHGANEGTRTPDRLITNQLLYQLSYIGMYNKEKNVRFPSSEPYGPDLGLQR